MRLLGIGLPYFLAGAVVLAVVASVWPAGLPETSRPAASTGPLVDVVCHMEVHPAWRFASHSNGETYRFCTRRCKELFDAAPEEYLASRCAVCDTLLGDRPGWTATYLERTYTLCSQDHRDRFKEDPAAYFLHTMWGIPSWLYYGSIGAVLLLSFGLFDLTSRRRGEASRRSVREAPGPRGFRVDLLSLGPIRAALCSRFFRFSLQFLMVGLFLLIIAAGLLGNQNPALNIAPILTWTIWWGLLPVIIIFAGKFWCYLCPWDALAGWAERLRLWRKSDDGLGLGLRWPRIIRNIAIATILFIGLTWVELGFGVTLKPRVTAYLALVMLILAVGSALLFDRRSFCRYGCLVGRVSGLYALFAGVEVRCRDASTCADCGGKECVRGSETAYGCPTFLYPGNLSTNTYCIQCMECVQACPRDNLALNLRPPGSDLATEGRPRTDEAYLALLMLSITGFHGLTMTPVWARLVEGVRETAGVGRLIGFTAAMAVILLAPVAVYAALVGLSRRLARPAAGTRPTYRDYFVRYAYALLPIALFYHIAHNLEHLLMEGPKVVALISDPFGWNWDLFGTASWTVPPLISLDRLWLVQVFLVLVGHVFSLWVAQKTSLRLFGTPRAALRSQLPMLAGMILFSIFSLWLLKQPMEMRTSVM